MKRILVIRECITDVRSVIKKYDKNGKGKYMESDDADYCYLVGDDLIHGFVVRENDDTKFKIFRLNENYDEVNGVDFGNPFYNHYIFVRSVKKANGVPMDKVVINKVLSKKLREKAKWK